MKTFRLRTVVLSTAVLCSLLACASALAATRMSGEFLVYESGPKNVRGSASALVTIGARSISVGTATARVRANRSVRNTFYEEIEYRCNGSSIRTVRGAKVTLPLREGSLRTVYVPAARATCPRGQRIIAKSISVVAYTPDRGAQAAYLFNDPRA